LLLLTSGYLGQSPRSIPSKPEIGRGNAVVVPRQAAEEIRGFDLALSGFAFALKGFAFALKGRGFRRAVSAANLNAALSR